MIKIDKTIRVFDKEMLATPSNNMPKLQCIKTILRLANIILLVHFHVKKKPLLLLRETAEVMK